MTPRSTLVADRQARHRETATAILSTMPDALAPLQEMARARGVSSAFESAPQAFTTARLVIAPDVADDVSLVMHAGTCTLVTSLSLAITANAMVHFGAAHRVVGQRGEDFFLWHTEREMTLSAVTPSQAQSRVVNELRDQLVAHFDDAVQTLLERARTAD